MIKIQNENGFYSFENDCIKLAIENETGSLFTRFLQNKKDKRSNENENFSC